MIFALIFVYVWLKSAAVFAHVLVQVVAALLSFSLCNIETDALFFAMTQKYWPKILFNKKMFNFIQTFQFFEQGIM